MARESQDGVGFSVRLAVVIFLRFISTGYGGARVSQGRRERRVSYIIIIIIIREGKHFFLQRRNLSKERKIVKVQKVWRERKRRNETK